MNTETAKKLRVVCGAIALLWLGAGFGARAGAAPRPRQPQTSDTQQDQNQPQAQPQQNSPQDNNAQPGAPGQLQPTPTPNDARPSSQGTPGAPRRQPLAQPPGEPNDRQLPGAQEGKPQGRPAQSVPGEPLDNRYNKRQQENATPPLAQPNAQEQAIPKAGQVPSQQDYARPAITKADPPPAAKEAAPQGRELAPAEKRGAFAEHRAQHWDAEHKSWQQRGGYTGFHLPDEQFTASFGRTHIFRIDALPMTVVGGHLRFRYHDFYFTVLDPVPEFFAADWFEKDRVYIDYDARDSGYYLVDTSHPDIRIAVEVTAA